MMPRPAIRIGILSAALLAMSAAAASATDFIVTKTADTADGVCDADCSLREAIIAANANPGPDRVVLGSGQVYLLTLGPADAPGALVAASGDLDITDGLTIDGNGSVVNAQGIDRVFDIEGAFTVVINNLTIKRGVASGFLSLGGGLYIKLASVVLNNSKVTGNSTLIESGARDDGGGIAVIGAFEPANGTLTLASLTLNATTVANNTGATGGGIVCVICQLTMTGGTISGNASVSGDGAGLAVLGSASTAMITGAALTANSGAARGGAVAVPVGTPVVKLTRARVVANSAGTGSGIFNTTGTISAANNWWGCNYGPGAAGAGCGAAADDTVGPGVSTSPYLVLRGTPSPSNFVAPGTATVTADLTFNSSNKDTSPGGTVPDGITAGFASTLGSMAQPSALTVNGKATGVFTGSQAGGTAALTVTVDNQTVAESIAVGAPAQRRPVGGDLDGDGLPELIVWRAPTGTWYWLPSSSGYNAANAASKQWGNQPLGDVPLLADIDGDGVSDLIVWRASTGTWYWLTSSTGYDYAAASSKQWGNQGLGDVPMLADIDGDGRADLVVWRASTETFYWLTSSTGYDYASAGSKAWSTQASGDVPKIGDFDGDGRADLAIWRSSTNTWSWVTSSTGYDDASSVSVQWGDHSLADVPFLTDLDGDGRADLLVWRASSGSWYWLTSSTSYSYAFAGARTFDIQSPNDVPMLGDMDADGKGDLILWRANSGTWQWLTSLSGYSSSAPGSRQWGSAAAGDVPIIR